MFTKKTFLLAAFASTSLLADPPPKRARTTLHVTAPNFLQWSEKVLNSVPNRILEKEDRQAEHIISREEFSEALDTVTSVVSLQNQAMSWMGGKVTHDLNVFDPHVQVLRRRDGHHFAFHGDFHGDIRSLQILLQDLNIRGFMNGFQITDNDFDLIFLGDYTDRGKYGVDVIYTLAWLKILNPHNVWLVRGNHEDLALNYDYGFTNEVIAFLAGSKISLRLAIKAIDRFYNALPVALFVGTQGSAKHILCMHGGIEPGYNHRLLLANEGDFYGQKIGKLDRAAFVSANRLALRAPIWNQEFYIKPDIHYLRPTDIGFLWNDFSLSMVEPTHYKEHRGLQASKHDSAVYMGSRVGAIFRGHQHDEASMPLLKEQGILNHWHKKNAGIFALQHGMVLTFCLGVDSYKGEHFGLDSVTYGLLHARGPFELWQIETVRKPLLMPAERVP